MSNVDEKSAAYRDEAPLSDDEQSCTSTSSLSDCSSDEEAEDSKKENNKPQQDNVRTKGELGLEDLPKIEELNIKIPEEDMEQIGKISAIVEQLVVVQSNKNSSPLYDDSVLFLAGGTPLGKVFEIFGPVIEPLYSVRFNSADDIKDKGIKIDDEVYYAPSHTEYTSYVFVASLSKEKGSDASWLHNNEPPTECLDYSDDEQEKAARHTLKARRRKPPQNWSSDAPEINHAGDAFTNKDFIAQPIARDVPLEQNYFREVYTRTPSSTPNSFWNAPSHDLHHSQQPNAAVAPASHMPSSMPYRPAASSRPVFGAICKPPAMFAMPSHCINVLPPPPPVNSFNRIPAVGIWTPPPPAFICMPPAKPLRYNNPLQGSGLMNVSSATTTPGYINPPQGSRHENMPPTSSASYSSHPQGLRHMNMPPATPPPPSYNIYSQGSQYPSSPSPPTPLGYGSQPQGSQHMNIPPSTPPSFSSYSQNSQHVSIPHSTVSQSYSSPSQGSQHSNMLSATSHSSSQNSISQSSQHVHMPPGSSSLGYNSNQQYFQRRLSPFQARNSQVITRLGIPVSPAVVLPAYTDSRWSNVPSQNRSGINQQAANPVAQQHSTFQQQPGPPSWPRTNQNQPRDLF